MEDDGTQRDSHSDDRHTSGRTTDIGGSHSGGQARSIGETLGGGQTEAAPGPDETNTPSEGMPGADDES